jgi:hypothetical protein
MKRIEAAVLDRLRVNGPCSFDDIVTYLPDLTWGEVFAAVDRMSRDGRLSLRQLGYSTYQISLGPEYTNACSTSSQTGQTTGNVIPIPQVAA